MQVDYFAHEFTQFDLHSTWRRATKDKDAMQNGRRLENASWRRFFQQHFHLKRVEASDIGLDRQSNWLVGPFHEYEALKDLESKILNQFVAKDKGRKRKSPISGLKRNSQNHHSLTRLAELTNAA